MFSDQRLNRRQLLVGASSLFLSRTATAGAGLPDHLFPPEQLAFAKAIDDYYLRSVALKDATARGRLVVERGQALRAAVGQSQQFWRWICVRHLASPLKDGSVHFILGVAGTRTRAMPSFSSPLSDRLQSVGVQSSSTLGIDLLSLSDRAVFLASGALVADDQGGFAENFGFRTTELREFELPGFVVQLLEAEQPAWLVDLVSQIRRR